MSFNSNPLLVKAYAYADRQHADQTRKGTGGEAYINHAVEVAEIIQKINGKKDTGLIAAALLHDVIENSDTTPATLSELFSDDIARLVIELSDEDGLDEAVRRQAQIDHARHLSSRAKLIKIADKISNLQEMLRDPPSGWSVEKQFAYLAWGEAVFAEIKGANSELDNLFSKTVNKLRTRLNTLLSLPLTKHRDEG